MVKTITIADDVYRELIRMRKMRNSPELLSESNKENKGNLDIVLKLAKFLNAKKIEKTKRKIERKLLFFV